MAIWDAFLTEQDRASLRGRQPRRWGFGRRPALLLVDLYRWVFGDGPEPLLQALARWPGHCGTAGWEALPHIVDVLQAARGTGIPVLHVTGLDPRECGMPGWAENPDAPAGPSDPDLAERLAHRYDIVEPVAPQAGETVLRKSAPSAFFGTPLMARLTQLGIDTLIVAGESTSGCVRATVVDARSYRLRVIVPAECVFDRHQAAHAINLFDMHQKYADVLPVAEVLAWLDGRGSSGAPS